MVVLVMVVLVMVVLVMVVLVMVVLVMVVLVMQWYDQVSVQIKVQVRVKVHVWEGEDVILEGEVKGSETSSIVGNKSTSWPEYPFVGL
ncbi:hypothetical protein Tco_0399396, partial [Tanacetum coccineum]